MTPEGRVKKKVKDLLNSKQVYHFSPQSGIYGRSGIPDIIGCYHGSFFAIECKAGRGTTTALQDKEIASIITAGGTALVVNEDNVDDMLTILGIYD